jgi:hypothetical protein
MRRGAKQAFLHPKHSIFPDTGCKQAAFAPQDSEDSVGGHHLSARVNGACELLVDQFGDTEVGRKFDEETGLNLYDL